MAQRIHGWVVLVCAIAAARCGGSGHDTAVAAATPDRTAAAAPATQADPAGMEHGDHNPHHGGVVYMYDDLHYEVVLDPAGHHRVFFTDAMREDLPASVASSVTLTVERPRDTPETVSGVIDQQGESWVLDGRPVQDTAASVRVAFVAKGSEYWIDVPFITPPTQ
jgi:hypothetical protein